MRRLFTTLALAVAIAAPALAQGTFTADASLARDDRQVRSVFLEDLKAVVVAAGHTITAAAGNSVTATNENGLIYNLDGTICENEIRPGCLGININVRYDGDDMVTYEKLNAANLNWTPVSVALEGEIGAADSSLIITRYVILDGGMSMANVKDNLTNALSIATSVADYVWEVGEYAPDYEDDLDDW
jgi:hypothetical protein